MPVPTQSTSERRKKNAERIGKAYSKAGDFAGKTAELVGKGLFGDDSGLPLVASMVPGADLGAKLASGKTPGLLDIPGPGTLGKALFTLTGIPLKGLFKQAGKKYFNKEVGESLAERLGRLPEEFQKGAAMTLAQKDSPAKGFRIPSLGVVDPANGGLAANSPAKSYYRDYSTITRPSNARNIWVKDMDPDAMAREFTGRLLGNAAPAELEKFSTMGQAGVIGLPDNATFGSKAASDIFGGNRKLFTDMGALADAGETGKLLQYLKNVGGDENLRYVLENANLKDKEMLPVLNSLFQKKSGVPLKGLSDGSTTNEALIELLSGAGTMNETKGALGNAMPKSVNDFAKSLNSDYPQEELFQLLGSGAQAGGDATLARAFGDAGGLAVDPKKYMQSVMPNIMKTASDRNNMIPLKKSFGKILSQMQKTLAKDPRMPNKGKISEFSFDFLE